MGVTSALMLQSRDAQSSDLSKTECNKDTKGRLVVAAGARTVLDSTTSNDFKIKK